MNPPLFLCERYFFRGQETDWFKGEYIPIMSAYRFSEYAVVSQHSLVKIDKAIPLDLAALFGCAVITGVGAVVNTAQLNMGDTATVVGLEGPAWQQFWRKSQWRKKRNWCGFKREQPELGLGGCGL